jgi:PAT family beta-lactamase induction signal transducer AmpG
LIEQFGYGFGFTVYMMFLLYFAKGQSETAHYAFCTGFMALSMMLPGLFAGHLQEALGYTNFFVLVCLLCPITCLVTKLVKVDPKFGQK